MTNYEQLKADIAAVVRANGIEAITGDRLQQVLTHMVDVLGNEYALAGVATPTTNPPTPDGNTAYIAGTSGTYTYFLDSNYNPLVVPSNCLTALLVYDASAEAWTAYPFGTIAQGTIGTNELADGAVTPPKLADSAVTSAKIGANAVTSAKINNGAVSEAKLATAVQNKINDAVTLSTSQTITGDKEFTQTVSLNGGAVSDNDLELAAADNVSIRSYGGTIVLSADDDAVVDAHRLDINNPTGIDGDLSVIGDINAMGDVDASGDIKATGKVYANTNDELSTKSYTDTQLAAKQDTIADLATIREGAALGTTALQDISDGSVTTPKIADGAVTTPKIADEAVTIAKIAPSAIDATPTENSGNLVTSGGVQSVTGNLSNLTTEDKDNLVEAVNEVNDFVSRSSTPMNTTIDYSSDYDGAFNGYLNGKTAVAGTTQYYSREFVMKENGMLCVSNVGATYLQLSVYTNNVISEASYVTRLRNTDNNLPTADNPLQLQKGYMVVVGAVNANVGWSLSFDYVHKEKRLSSDIEVSYDQVSDLPNANLLFKYSQGSEGTTADYVAEFVNILIPTRVGYISAPLVRSVLASRNADNWRVGKLWLCGKNRSRLTALTAGGSEFECAIKLLGRSDFSGGIAHGDRVTTEITWLVDGKVVTASSLTSWKECSEIRCYTKSNLYDPNDSTTIFAEHTVEYIWTNKGFDINQTVKFLVAETLAESYLAMFPILQTLSRYYALERDLTPVAIPSGLSNFVTTGSSRVMLWENNGVFSQFGITRYPTNYVNPYRLLITNNGGTAYNKCYFYVTLPNGGSTAAVNDRWQSSTEYRFAISYN